MGQLIVRSEVSDLISNMLMLEMEREREKREYLHFDMYLINKGNEETIQHHKHGIDSAVAIANKKLSPLYHL